MSNSFGERVALQARQIQEEVKALNIPTEVITKEDYTGTCSKSRNGICSACLGRAVSDCCYNSPEYTAPALPLRYKLRFFCGRQENAGS